MLLLLLLCQVFCTSIQTQAHQRLFLCSTRLPFRSIPTLFVLYNFTRFRLRSAAQPNRPVKCFSWGCLHPDLTNSPLQTFDWPKPSALSTDLSKQNAPDILHQTLRSVVREWI